VTSGTNRTVVGDADTGVARELSVVQPHATSNTRTDMTAAGALIQIHTGVDPVQFRRSGDVTESKGCAFLQGKGDLT
jgi:hypothetical protein